MAEINDLTVIDDSNTARWPEGMALASVNNAARATEGILARWYQDIRGIAVVTGSGGAYVLTVNRAITALYDGLDVTFRPNHANPGASTLAVNGLAATAIKIGGDVDTFANAFKVGQVVRVVYDGTNFQVVSGLSVVDTSAPNVFTADQTISSDDAGALLGPTLSLRRDSASPAASDQIGRLILEGRNSAAALVAYARLRGIIEDPTDASESGILTFQTQRAGAVADRVRVGDGVYTRANGTQLTDQGDGTANYSAYFARNGFLLRNYIAGLEMTNGTDSDHDIDIAVGQAADSANAEMLTRTSVATIAIDNAADRVDGSTLDADTVYYVLVGRDGTSAVAGFSKVTTKPTDWEAFRVRGAVVTDATSNIINNRFMVVLPDNRERFLSEQVTPAVGATASLSTGLTKSPYLSSLVYVCLTAEGGYAVGDRTIVDFLGSNFALQTAIVQNAGATAVTINNNSTNGLVLPQKGAGASFLATEANWAYELVLETL